MDDAEDLKKFFRLLRRQRQPGPSKYVRGFVAEDIVKKISEELDSKDSKDLNSFNRVQAISTKVFDELKGGLMTDECEFSQEWIVANWDGIIAFAHELAYQKKWNDVWIVTRNLSQYTLLEEPGDLKCEDRTKEFNVFSNTKLAVGAHVASEGPECSSLDCCIMKKMKELLKQKADAVFDALNSNANDKKDAKKEDTAKKEASKKKKKASKKVKDASKKVKDAKEAELKVAAETELNDAKAELKNAKDELKNATGRAERAQSKADKHKAMAEAPPACAPSDLDNLLKELDSRIH